MSSDLFLTRCFLTRAGPLLGLNIFGRRSPSTLATRAAAGEVDGLFSFVPVWFFHDPPLYLPSSPRTLTAPGGAVFSYIACLPKCLNRILATAWWNRLVLSSSPDRLNQMEKARPPFFYFGQDYLRLRPSPRAAPNVFHLRALFFPFFPVFDVLTAPPPTGFLFSSRALRAARVRLLMCRFHFRDVRTSFSSS